MQTCISSMKRQGERVLTRSKVARFPPLHVRHSLIDRKLGRRSAGAQHLHPESLKPASSRSGG
jgi:hypothetical protein